MVWIDAPLILAVSALFTSLSAVIWSLRRKRGGGGGFRKAIKPAQLTENPDTSMSAWQPENIGKGRLEGQVGPLRRSWLWSLPRSKHRRRGVRRDVADDRFSSDGGGHYVSMYAGSSLRRRRPDMVLRGP